MYLVQMNKGAKASKLAAKIERQGHTVQPAAAAQGTCSYGRFAAEQGAMTACNSQTVCSYHKQSPIRTVKPMLAAATLIVTCPSNAR